MELMNNKELNLKPGNVGEGCPPPFYRLKPVILSNIISRRHYEYDL